MENGSGSGASSSKGDGSCWSSHRLRDIGRLATWSVSSSKPGFGINQLTDPSLDTFWQSEGPQPHLINIQFSKRMTVSQLSIFVDVSIDDSYTPNRISIRAGSYHGDVQEVKLIDLEQPRGWQHYSLGSASEDDQDVDRTDPEAFSIKARLIQIAVLSNHLSGKDTHIRNIKVFAPKDLPSIVEDDEDTFSLLPFTSRRMQPSTVR